MKQMKTITVVLVLLFLAGNAFADKNKTVTCKMKDSSAGLNIKHEDDNNSECLVSSTVTL